MLNDIEINLKKRKLNRRNVNEKEIKRIKVVKEKLITNLFDLPNELFYQIYSYLTYDQLLKSFHLLTSDGRFDKLIFESPSINFRSIERSLLIANEHLINSKIIHQLYLFNDDNTPGLINRFFSYYSFDLINHFPNLQNLVLDQPEQNDLIKLLKSFGQLKHLSIRLCQLVRMPSVVYTNLYSSVFSSSNLQSLTIIDDPDEPILFPDQISFPYLRSLTLSSLTFSDLQKILRSSPQLNSLKFHLDADQSKIQLNEVVQTNLTRIDIDGPRAEFELIEKILRQMKKLKSLKLICRGVDGYVWECFIKEFLPNLIDFHFKFDIRQKNVNICSYQTNWWKSDKNWIVISHPLSPFVYTIPFIDQKLILNARTAFRQDNCLSSKKTNEYKNIRQLILTLNPLGFKLCTSDDVYFPSVESLTLIDYKNNEKPVTHLTNLINLTTIRHLTIDHRMRSLTFSLLIRQMTNLNSLSGSDSAFSSITNKFQNEKIVSFIKLNIQSLTINPFKPCQDIRYVSQLCSIFSHIHHLTLTMKSSNQIWPWLNKLTHLHSATVFCRYGSFIDIINHQHFPNINYELRSQQDLRLWIK